MSVTMIQDLRWGDTGKGKLSEYLSSPDKCDVSVRAVGGGNAGHVIIIGTRKLALHVLPAGCVHQGVDLVLGRGMVTHLPTLFDDAEKAHHLFGADPIARLVIAEENHILLEGHKLADAAMEERKGGDAVGTTKSGIGPAYADKALRQGMRFGELLYRESVIKDRYQRMLRHWQQTYGITPDSTTQERDVASLLKAKELLEVKIQNLTPYWRKKFAEKARVTIEGAQGSLLSIDNGGYPYVTSSATTVNGHLQGAGIPLREVTHIIGTLKAYETRVGNGELLTAMPPEFAARIVQKGGETGSTTGRVRRPGWLHATDTANRAWEESCNSLAVFKGDVFDDEGSVRLGKGNNGKHVFYEDMDGWSGTRGVREFGALHENAQAFYNRIGEIAGLPVEYIGTGPEHDDLIVRKI